MKKVFTLILVFVLLFGFGTAEAEAATKIRFNKPIVEWSNVKPYTITWQGERGSHRFELKVYVNCGIKKHLVKDVMVRNTWYYNLRSIFKKYPRYKISVAIRSLGTSKKRTSLWNRSSEIRKKAS